MRYRMALLDLKTVRQAYEQNEFQAAGAIKKFYNKGVTVVFVSNGPRSGRTEAWLKEKKLDQYSSIFRTDVAKNKFIALILRVIPVNLKHFFVNDLIESMNSGETQNADRIFYADTNEKTRKAIGKLKDKRLVICDSLIATANKVF